MQTIQFLKTVKWIKSQFSTKTRSLILEGELLNIMRHTKESEGGGIRIDTRSTKGNS